MSRSGYSDDGDVWVLIRWRGAVKSAIRGARGQAMLRELIQALDALPEKRLAADSLVTADGEYCTLGALGRARGIDLTTIDPDDRRAVADAFGVAEALAAEIMFENDERAALPRDWIDVEICGPMRYWETHHRRVSKPIACVAEHRWQRMREWALSHLIDGETR